MDPASLARGLNVRLNNQQLIENEKFLYQAEVQKDAQKKKEAWMLTSDIQFGKAFDPYNKSRLDEHNNTIMDQITSMVSDGDMASNPEKLMKLKQLKSSLLDNEIVDESLRFMANKEMRMKFQADPRNQEFLNEPEFIEAMKREKMYEQTGSANGDINNKEEYSFTPPPVKINTAEIIASSFGALQQHGISSWGQGIDGYRQFVKNEDKIAAAENLYNDGSLEGKALRREWMEMSDEERKVYANSPTNWIIERGKGYAPADKYQSGKVFNPNSSSSSKTKKGPIRDKFRETTLDPLLGKMGLRIGQDGYERIPGINPVANPELTVSALRGTAVGKQGDVNLHQAVIYDANGKAIPIDFGYRSKGASETTRVRMRSIEGNDGKPMPDPNRPLEMEIAFEIPVTHLQRYEDKFQMIDPDWFEFEGAFEEDDDFDISDSFEGIISKTGNVQNGDQTVMVKAWIPLNSDHSEMVNNTYGKKQDAAVDRGYPQEGETRIENGYEFTFVNGRWK